MMPKMLMCRMCGAHGNPFEPKAWLNLTHLSDTCARVQARRDGEPVVLHYGDSQRVWDTYYEHERLAPSLDLGHRMAATSRGTMASRRVILAAFREPGVTFRRRRTIQGSPVFIVETRSRYRPERMAIGIGETWTDAVARAWDMWASGT